MPDAGRPARGPGAALGVIRVRGGQIIRYEGYMDPVALARILGHTADLAAALTGA